MTKVAAGAVIAAGLASAALGGLTPAAADPGLPPDPQIPAPAPAPAPPSMTGAGPDPLALAQMLMPQNYRMPTPDQISPYALAPNTDPSPFARIDAWKGVHALLYAGLGRMPGDELGRPLPGTAPPADSNMPPGLEQFYIPPAPVG